MASPSGSGASSGGSTSQPSSAAAAVNSGSEEDQLGELIRQRKARRMLSNRESARRSRMRKQQHLDDLTAQAAQLRDENARALAALGAASRSCLAMEAENAVLRTQIAELDRRLQSLDDIFLRIGAAANDVPGARVVHAVAMPTDAAPANPWSFNYQSSFHCC